MTVAFAAKMFVAVWLGKFLLLLSPVSTTVISAAIFFLSAALIWCKDEEKIDSDSQVSSKTSGALVAFASLVFCEWIDPGQISASVLTAQSNLPFAVWIGGTLALLTKGVLALLIGVTLRNKIPAMALRKIAATSFAIIGLFSLGRLFIR